MLCCCSYFAFTFVLFAFIANVNLSILLLAAQFYIDGARGCTHYRSASKLKGPFTFGYFIGSIEEVDEVIDGDKVESRTTVAKWFTALCFRTDSHGFEFRTSTPMLVDTSK